MKKSMNTIAVVLAGILSLSVSACGASQTTTSPKGDSAAETERNKASSGKSRQGVSVDDLPWSVDQTMMDGFDRVILTYTNNTDKTIIDFDIISKIKPETTDEQLDQHFAEMKNDFDLSNDDLRDYQLDCHAQIFTEAGQQSQPSACVFGALYAQSKEQTDLWDPAQIIVRYLNDDGTTYGTTYYDFASKKTRHDTAPKSFETVPESPRGQMVPKPSEPYIEDVYDSEDGLSFTILNMSEQEYRQYLADCQSLGWITESDLGSNVDFSEKDGWELGVTYWSESNHVSVDLDKVD